MVAPSVVAAYHQHLFCARLDLALDDPEGGKGLVVSEVSHRLPNPDLLPMQLHGQAAFDAYPHGHPETLPCHLSLA